MSEEGLINIKCMIIINLLSALFIPALLHETASLESIPLNQDVSYTGVSDPLWQFKVWSYAISLKRM